METKIAVIGLGYVGLPLALTFARKIPNVVGFDIDSEKIDSLKKGIDFSGLELESELKSTTLKITSNETKLKDSNFFIVAVPTPVDHNNKPDLGALISASQTVGRSITKGDIVVFESTVYPGVTEEICGPEIEKVSGLRRGVDFTLAYSPERINPGDTEHTLENVIKIIAAEDAATLQVVKDVYSKIVKAGLYSASSIKVAEAAKVIENTQRDLNIALMNELAIIFDRIGISSREVIEAAGTKWNFLKFSPGLVGGHCIGVDPYYLTTKAEQVGYHPEVILAGRRINDQMGTYVAQKTVKLMVNRGIQVKGARVAILGLTFKENVPDIRNSRVPDIARELREFGANVFVHDPLVDPSFAKHEVNITLSPWEDVKDLDALILAVSHKTFIEMGFERLACCLSKSGVFIDVKSAFHREVNNKSVCYWAL